MIFNKRKKILLKELKRIKKELLVKYHPKKVILFGSLLTGRVRRNSDIDLVIVKETDKPFIERALEFSSDDLPAEFKLLMQNPGF